MQMLTTTIIVVASDRVKVATAARKEELACSRFGGSSVFGIFGSDVVTADGSSGSASSS